MKFFTPKFHIPFFIINTNAYMYTSIRTNESIPLFIQFLTTKNEVKYLNIRYLHVPVKYRHCYISR